MNELDLLKVLDKVDPALLEYQEWVNVGMALKTEGYTAADWDAWSSKDMNKYKSGECFKKWLSFHEDTSTPVTGGTIVEYAKRQGWKLDEGHALDWDCTITIDDELKIIDGNWIEGQEIEEPANWRPAQEIIKYLETLFESTENVGYVTQTYEHEGTYSPTKGSYDRTAGQLIQELSQCGDDIGAVFGDYREEVGAWIRFNPLDGKGVRNDNVTDYRFALVESDNMELDKQNAIIRELELPVACLVFSGKKSIHAIVRIDAADYSEYRKRVDYLYQVCEKNGLQVDKQNRNPSRLSRMPGVTRNGRKQFLIDTNIGKSDWNTWYDWIEGINDDLPEPEPLTDSWDNLPELAPPLIHNVLRQGHKMLMAGPSKAGKSFALIQLCIAIAEGRQWLGWDCAQGRVMYVNLELDRASCLHRFKDVYHALNYKAENIGNIDIWNLRGKSVPMDKLAPKLIRRAQKKDYIAIVIDPIYKVITGDENSADQMAHFTNQFDKVCTELGSSVIYCHHHSKGYQGGKRSMDRASGSGVFARDPDALLDLTELDVNDDLMKAEENRLVAEFISMELKKLNAEYWDDISIDDTMSQAKMKEHLKNAVKAKEENEVLAAVERFKEDIKRRTAWRVEGTLREFASFEPKNLWFDYPTHKLDELDVLKDVQPESEKPAWQKAMDKRKSPEAKAEERKTALEVAFEACNVSGDGVTINELAEYLGVTNRTVWNRIKEHGGYESVSSPGKETIILPVARV